jgi:hypothetical protein
MGWKVYKLWKAGEKKEFFMVIGIGLIAAYFLLAKKVNLPTVNLLQDLENITYPIGLWLQKLMGITFLE